MTPTTEPHVAPGTRADTLASATRLLLDARNPAGHWVGELSSSALSTATAVFALWTTACRNVPGTAPPGGVDPARGRALVRAGVDWLLRHRNADGGWGDTTVSASNISTTALCWAALGAAGGGATDPAAARAAFAAAEAWLARAAGSVDPWDLARAIADRYGKDRTFSVPILTMCALAGRLGSDGENPWRLVPQLPFEVAAFPQSWFRFFRLPVVSYALPALISIGLVRHRSRPARNPLARLVRAAATARALRTLSAVQPAGGGFLEATPLTSFVAMSLAGAGLGGHPVVAAGLDFLARSARPDGSWPIDTNLATWVTTLSVNALAAGGGGAAVGRALSPADRAAVRDWLLAQQYRARHPYTGAPPGAWAWTDLPGGVPDADDTAGALLALHHLGDADDADPRVVEAATAGVRWLLDLQNADGGIPTFCRGWNNLPFDRSGPDLTAHALLAWAAWRDRLPPKVAAHIDHSAERAVRYLARQQRADGAWVPLWFGNEAVPGDENPTYGTAKVLFALLGRPGEPAASLARRGVAWLASAQNPDGGWGGGPGTPSSVEETALAVDALALAAGSPAVDPAARPAAAAAAGRGCDWLVARTDGGRRFDPAAIGFYFAKLWYFERAYPLLMTVAALGRIGRHEPAAAGRPGGGRE